MKTKIFVTLMFFLGLINNSCIAQCSNELAVKKFENDLETITNSIKNTSMNLKELPDIIKRIEIVSNIESESDGNYFGKFNPTTSDVTKWRNWFKENKNKICWDENKNLYYIIK